MAQLRMHLLGAPRIEMNGQPVETDRRKAVALLVYLAVTHQPRTRDELASLFWPEADDTRAFANLRRTLWEINQMLGKGWLDADRQSIRLNAEQDFWLDVLEIQFAIERDDLASVEAIVPLIRGDFLAGFSLRDSAEFDTWQQQQVAFWQRAVAEGLQKLVDGLVRVGRLETAVSTLQKMLTLDPLEESAHRQVMQLYAELGQRTMAIRQYDHCVQTLKKELGVEPEQATIDLFEQIKVGRVVQKASSSERLQNSAPAEKPPSLPHNLPVQPTPFVGRESTKQEIGTLLLSTSTRLITLIGPGGSGKTRLALEVARTSLTQFAAGVWFVPLVSLGSVDAIVTAVAHALNFTFYEDDSTPEQQLMDFLRNKNLLLVMDNFEHLIEAGGAAFVSRCLSVAAGVKIIATSRMRLNVQGENLVVVGGMRLPKEETAVSWLPEQFSTTISRFSALQLFQNSALRVKPGFTLSAENIDDVIAICRQVHGLPLGIELAASWMEMLSPAEIRHEIDNNLDFLETETQDVPERQRSLRAVFNYSWELMNADEQQLFPQLALFQGGFSREAAQVVAQTNLRTLMRLVNKSLVRREENGRFVIHELLRQYATEIIQKDADTLFEFRSRHSKHYLQFLAKQSKVMQGPNQRDAYDAVGQELSNIQAAWFWGVAHGEYKNGLTGLSGLFNYYLVRSNLMFMIGVLDLVLDDVSEAAAADLEAGRQSTHAQHLHGALVALMSFVVSFDYASSHPKKLSLEAIHLADLYGIRSRMGIYFLLAANIFMWRNNRQEGAVLVQEAIQYLREDGSKWELAVGLSIVGGSLWVSNKKDAGRALIDEGIELSRALGDRIVLAYLLGSMAHVTGDEHDFVTTLNIYEECLEIYESVGNRRGVGDTFIEMGATFDAMGEYEQALIYYRRGRDVFEKLGDRHSVARALSWESLSARRMGQYAYALTLREQSQQIYEALQDVNGMSWCYFEKAELFFLTGDEKNGWHFLRKSKALFDANEMLRGHSFHFRVEGWQFLHKKELDKAKDALATSVKLSIEDYHSWNVSCARSWLGLTLLAEDDVVGAKKQIAAALSEAQALSNLGVSLLAITAYARLLLTLDEFAFAIELAAFAEAHPALWDETRWMVKAVTQSASSNLDKNAIANATKKGKAWQLDDLLNHLLSEANDD